MSICKNIINVLYRRFPHNQNIRISGIVFLVYKYTEITRQGIFDRARLRPLRDCPLPNYRAFSHLLVPCWPEQ